MSKPIVNYRGAVTGVLGAIVIGVPVILEPINHKNHVEGQQVSNNKPVFTSPVVSYDGETGTVETLNTIYIPEKN